MYIISKRLSSKIFRIRISVSFRFSLHLKIKDGKAFGKKNCSVLAWYCLYNQFVCFILGTTTMNLYLIKIIQNSERENAETKTVWKVSKYGVFSGPYFSVFELNTEICSVILCIQSEFRKMRTRKKLRVWTLFTQCQNQHVCWDYTEVIAH